MTILMVSLFLIVRHVHKQHNMMKQYSKQKDESTRETLDPEVVHKCEAGLRALKVSSIQSIAYIGSFILTFFF